MRVQMSLVHGTPSFQQLSKTVYLRLTEDHWLHAIVCKACNDINLAASTPPSDPVAPTYSKSLVNHLNGVQWVGGAIWTHSLSFNHTR